MRTTTNQITEDGLLINGYDYVNQAWVVDGVYQRCGHPDEGTKIITPWGEEVTAVGCICYGKEHEGERCEVRGDGRL